MNSVFEWWGNFWAHSDFWNAFWPSIWGALVGAIVAFLLERRYRRSERVSYEVGQCNKLIFILGQMLSCLEDINESLFITFKKKHGRTPDWHEIPGLIGAPVQGPDFVIGEYTFLLEDDDTKSKAPEILGDPYRAEANFKTILLHVNLRTKIWNEWSERRASAEFLLGEEGVSRLGEANALTRQLKELTAWLAEDIPECIDSFQKLMPNLDGVLKSRYPGRGFIRLRPVISS